VIGQSYPDLLHGARHARFDSGQDRAETAFDRIIRIKWDVHMFRQSAFLTSWAGFYFSDWKSNLTSINRGGFVRFQTSYSGEPSQREANVNHLIIAAHPRRKSFNHSVIEAYTAALTERGHRVGCHDLYAMGFNPVLSAQDVAAIARGNPTGDIRTELNAIRSAEVVTLISPLWWSGFPAMLKGYVDRVFTAASAYLSKDKKARPGLSGKKGAIIMTSEASLDELKSGGALRALKKHHQEMMEYCGAEFVGQLYLGGIDPAMSRTAGEKHLEAVRRFVRHAF
jgi:NAD(P)H dehydrogenase (quinone)